MYFTGSKTDAVVIGVEYFSGTRGMNLDYSFKDNKGQEYTNRIIYTSRNHDVYKVGEIFPIVYDPDNVNKVIFVSEYIFIFPIFGLIFVVLTFLIFYGFCREYVKKQKVT